VQPDYTDSGHSDVDGECRNRYNSYIEHIAGAKAEWIRRAKESDATFSAPNPDVCIIATVSHVVPPKSSVWDAVCNPTFTLPLLPLRRKSLLFLALPYIITAVIE